MNNPFKNRELSWLQFNQRVLGEVFRDRNPLFEKYRFLSIFNSNLDEFYMIRVGGLIDQKSLQVDLRDNKTQLSAEQQLKLIYQETNQQIQYKDQAYKQLIHDFIQHNIHHLSADKHSDVDHQILKESFDKDIAHLLSAQIVNNKHPLPFFQNKQSYIILELERKEKIEIGIISINTRLLPSLLVLPLNKSYRFMLLEDIVYLFAHRLFKDWNVKSKGIIRILRNADLESQELDDLEDQDFRESMKLLIKKRSRMSAVRMDVKFDLNPTVLERLKKHLNLSQAQIFKHQSPLSYEYLGEIETRLKDKKLWELFYPQQLQRMTPYLNHQHSLIPQVLKRDIFISYPFNPIQSFIQFIKEASQDPKVISIKITLYRVASDSRILEYLIQAAESGKEVIVVMELKARFDESNNIEWSAKLEEAGIQVIYGVSQYKVHSKIALIVRKDGRNIQTLTHVSSGNYNEKTSKIYTDVNIITAHPEIGQDAIVFFNNLLADRIAPASSYRHLCVSPFGIKETLIQLIQQEVQDHQQTKEGRIIFKMNSLTDVDILHELILASQAGVKIDLIVRGICCLIPGVEGFTENIKVRSIVGRYLEHSRIYYFSSQKNHLYYISSADLMTRNMEKRIELALPIYSPEIKQELQRILTECLLDTSNAYLLNEKGEYHSIEQNPPYDMHTNLFIPLFERESSKNLSSQTWWQKLGLKFS